jgi:hypothetical protein
MLLRMGEDTGRWVRIPGVLRDELAELNRTGAHPAVDALIALYDRARPEDWIAQLVEVNRELVEESRRLQALSPADNPRRQTA